MIVLVYANFTWRIMHALAQKMAGSEKGDAKIGRLRNCWLRYQNSGSKSREPTYMHEINMHAYLIKHACIFI